ncbi:MAG: biopolymer transporter ExbD [Deltaproteobacteria bacterium]|nr:biopolymer transporter ExbD [Deltaproteobacteria bacterium]
MAATARNDEEIIADINVTPLVDIVLVLLIIFMVTASVIVTPAIKVDLPRAANAEDNPETTVSVVMSREGRLFLNGDETDWAGLSERIKKSMAAEKDVQAVISADREVSHGDVVHLIDTVKGLGVVKFALNIERVEYKAGGR